MVLDDEYENEWVQDSGLRILSHSGFVEYPHAGILNEPIWLHRYPTTETNRNRARARWTFYHFLGVDIETSAPRTTDPVALADTNNPTLNNPACTVCHSRLDPLAGAYQNYGNEGIYRSAWGGLDALPDTYKYPEWFEENPAPLPISMAIPGLGTCCRQGLLTPYSPATELTIACSGLVRSWSTIHALPKRR